MKLREFRKYVQRFLDKCPNLEKFQLNERDQKVLAEQRPNCMEISLEDAVVMFGHVYLTDDVVPNEHWCTIFKNYKRSGGVEYDLKKKYSDAFVQECQKHPRFQPKTSPEYICWVLGR